MLECASVSQPPPQEFKSHQNCKTTSRRENLRHGVKSRSSLAKHQVFQVPPWSLGPTKGPFHSFMHFSLTIIPMDKWAWPMPLVLTKQRSSHWLQVIPISSMLIPEKETSQISKLRIKSNCLVLERQTHSCRSNHGGEIHLWVWSIL